MPDTLTALASPDVRHPSPDEAARLLADWIEQDVSLPYPRFVKHLLTPGHNTFIDVVVEFGVTQEDLDEIWFKIWVKTAGHIDTLKNGNSRLLSQILDTISQSGIRTQ